MTKERQGSMIAKNFWNCLEPAFKNADRACAPWRWWDRSKPFGFDPRRSGAPQV
jgi:hypothetical protein